MSSLVGKVFGIIIAVGTVVGMYYAFETHFARASTVEEIREEVAAVSDRVDAMKLEDELLLVKKKMFNLEDRWSPKFKEEYGRYPHSIDELLAFMPKEYRDEYRELDDKRKDLEKKIEEKNKKKGG